MALKSSSKTFPGFEAIQVLGDPGSEREFVGDLEVPQGREFELLRGDWVPAKPLELRWEMGRATPGDVIWTTLAVIVIVSSRFLSLLSSRGFSGWSAFPVVVRDKSGAIVEGYSGLSIHGRCGDIDNSRSELVQKDFPGGTFPVHRGLFFGADDWDGSDMFCARGGSGWIFVTREVANAIEAAKFKNISLEPTTEVERASL